ncbi:MAG TPA: hypothetical protein DCR27_13420 [Lachnospiraceae bacterium]|nr:hypothetical protein [Lachnospiraceae bacterium]
MDLHIIFYNFYEGHLYHVYLNALFLSKKYGSAVVTHQEYVKQELKYEDCFLNTFDMEKITEDDRKEIQQFGIPNAFYENLEKQFGSKTQAILHLYSTRDAELEKYLYGVLDACKSQVNRFYVFGETYESIRFIAGQKNITIVNYEFSTIRKTSGYPCDLMQAFTCGSLYSHRELMHRYKKFRNEIDGNILLKREELIALFAPDKQLLFIPLIYEKPEFEIGILDTGFGVITSYCKNSVCTDDDVYAMCRKHYKSNQIVHRKHPATLPAESLERGSYEKDTIAFILSCKRIASVSSNGLFEAMLWGRTSCIALDAMAFYFMCEHNFQSEKIVDEVFLNFYLIAALVPSQKLLFDPQYWEMRTKMSEGNLYHYHLNYILDLLGTQKKIFDMPYAERLKNIIANRGMDTSILSAPTFAYDQPFYANLKSELCVHSNGGKMLYTCVNYQIGDEIISSFKVNSAIDFAEFFPHREKTGFIEIKKLLADGKEIQIKNDGLEYVLQQYPKTFASFPSGPIGTLQILWRSGNNSTVNMRQISMQCENLHAEIDNLHAEISNIRNSYSWKITKPLRRIRSCLNRHQEGKCK